MLGIVVLLGAAMATATPALDPGFTDRVQVGPTPPLAVEADDLLVQARAIPAHPGVNTIELRIGETRRPSPGAITAVAIGVLGAHHVVVPNEDGVAFVEGVVLPRW